MCLATLAETDPAILSATPEKRLVRLQAAGPRAPTYVVLPLIALRTGSAKHLKPLVKLFPKKKSNLFSKKFSKPFLKLFPKKFLKLSPKPFSKPFVESSTKPFLKKFLKPFPKKFLKPFLKLLPISKSKFPPITAF